MIRFKAVQWIVYSRPEVVRMERTVAFNAVQWGCEVVSSLVSAASCALEA